MRKSATRWAFAAVVALSAVSCSDDDGHERTLAALGQACEEDADCDGMLTCDTDRPGGLCTRECSKDSTCGRGGVCIEAAGAGACFRSCERDADCERDGHHCAGSGRHRLCDADEEPDAGMDAGQDAGQDAGEDAGQDAGDNDAGDDDASVE